MALIKQGAAYTRAFYLGEPGVSPAVLVSKAGAAFAPPSGVVDEISDGWYKIALTEDDTDTLGDLAYHITAVGADDLDMCDQVVPAPPGELVAAYDPAKSAASQASVDAVGALATAIEADTQDLQAQVGAAGAGLTALGDTRLAALDAAITSRAPASTALSTAQWTNDRAAKLDNLDAAVTSRASAATALSNAVWTDTRAGKLDNLDAAITTRLATVGYTAPDNAGITAIKTQTDKLAFTGNDVKATLDGETVAVGDKTGFALTSAYDAAKVAASQASVDAVYAVAGAIKTKTDALPAEPAAVSDIPTAVENADALLKRDMGAVTGEADRSPLNALRCLRNKVAIQGNMLIVCRENDLTPAWTAELTTDPAAQPITSVDPT